jgi:hypothetical protein
MGIFAALDPEFYDERRSRVVEIAPERHNNRQNRDRLAVGDDRFSFPAD